jgi:lipoprotein-anchoring transpeptidase ErfK/SrfK
VTGLEDVESTGRSLEDSESPAYVDRILVVDRERYEIRLYDLPLRAAVEYEVRSVYPISVGTDLHNTPRGMYRINTKVKYPAWTMPNSEWIPEELRGTVVPGGAERNPLKERWLGVTPPEDGIGIHGTGDLDSIGRAASHGCVRMRPADVIDLYAEVPIGSPCHII